MPPQITVAERPDGDFDVSLPSGETTLHYIVSAPSDLALTLGADPAELVRESFVFLLEKEPATSILSRFGLEVISQYFPDYPAEIARRLG